MEQKHPPCTDTDCLRLVHGEGGVCQAHPDRVTCDNFLRRRPDGVPCVDDQERTCLDCHEPERCPLMVQ